MRIFETHAHINSDDYKTDRAAMLQQCTQAGVERILDIGTDEPTSRAAIALAEKYPFIYAAVGYHPHDAETYNEAVIRELITHPEVIALGEVGLDYYRSLTPKKLQQDVFAAQVNLAAEYRKPLIIHDREAHQDCMDILDAQNAKRWCITAFPAMSPMRRMCWKKVGSSLSPESLPTKTAPLPTSFAWFPPIDFCGNRQPVSLTGSPQGKRNSPAYLRHIIEKIAEIKHLPPMPSQKWRGKMHQISS